MKAPKPKSDFRRGFVKECEEYAKEFRDELGIAIHEPLPAAELARTLEIKLLPFRDIALHQNQLRMLQRAVSAATIRGSDGQPIILYNCAHAGTRTESNIMHEIAHLLLNHDAQAKKTESSGLVSRHYDKQMEKEAEKLGSILQIPSKGLEILLRQHLSHEEIATRFGASKMMVFFRYNTTGLKRQGLVLN